jgi:hypothetical protein
MGIVRWCTESRTEDQRPKQDCTIHLYAMSLCESAFADLVLHMRRGLRDAGGIDTFVQEQHYGCGELLKQGEENRIENKTKPSRQE